MKPFQVAASKPARRTYINSLFAAFASTVLLGIAITAYLLFYYAHVPIRGFSRPVYLQFEPDRNPYAIVEIDKGLLVSNQPYDVNVNLHLPRTQTNANAGNFMIDVQLLAPELNLLGTEAPEVLVHERRPSILPFYSKPIDIAHKALGLPLYLFGWRREEERLTVPLMEGVEFARGWRRVPAKARIELQSAAHLQVYSMSVDFRTRLRGLRYVP